MVQMGHVINIVKCATLLKAEGVKLFTWGFHLLKICKMECTLWRCYRFAWKSGYFTYMEEVSYRELVLSLFLFPSTYVYYALEGPSRRGATKAALPYAVTFKDVAVSWFHVEYFALHDN